MADITQIAPDFYRISIFWPEINLAFNQFLLVDREPLLYHAGMKWMFPQVRQAVATVLDPAQLRWIGTSHFESDECGALNQWLELAPQAQVVCTMMAAMVNLNDFASRPPHPLGKKDVLSTGRFSFRMRHTPHLPHGWDAGMMFEETIGLLLCSDLFHHNGPVEPLTQADPVPASRQALAEYQRSPLKNYMPYTQHTGPMMKELADLRPQMLAPMHGPACIGDGQQALHGLAEAMREILGS